MACYKLLEGGEYLKNSIKVSCEWYLYDESGLCIKGPLTNYVTGAGLTAIASSMEAFESPYLVIGDDSTPGETITESYRKAVSYVSRSGPIISFRIQLLADEGNGNHEKTCIFIGASSISGTGTMLNLLTVPWSKTSNTLLTVEARFTVSN